MEFDFKDGVFYYFFNLKKYNPGKIKFAELDSSKARPELRDLVVLEVLSTYWSPSTFTTTIV